METLEQQELKRSTRRSKKVKNLEEEVEFIFSQDESDEDVKENVEEIFPKTPSRRDKRKNETTTPKATPRAVLQEVLQTPRRSCRKSIRPAQEYDEIVNKSLRSCTRSGKKKLLITEEEEVENNGENQVGEIVQPKWTPAKVGRVSQKRNRKSRRNGKGKNNEAKQVEDVEETNKNQKNEHKDQEEEQTKCEKDPGQVKVSEVVSVEDVGEEQITVDCKDVEINEQMEKEEEKETKREKESEEVKDFKFVSVMDAKEQLQPKKEINVQITAEQTEEKDKNECLEIKYKSNLDEFNRDSEEEGTAEKAKEIENGKLTVTTADEAQFTQKDNQDKEEVDNEIYNALEVREESIHVLLDENDDCKEIRQKSEDGDICIVYENNISNNEIKDELEDKENDSFGSYLKSKQINISDLGLNLLKDDEEEKEKMDLDNVINPTEDVEDMPSLIVCDDDDDNDDVDCTPSIKLNETFEADDCKETDTFENVDNKISENNESENEAENITRNANEEIMETLQMSDDDDGETPRKPPRVVKDTPHKKQSIFTELKDSAVKVNPKEIVLRGIRKRSLSLCINGNEQNDKKFLAGPLAKAKQDRMVSFYSPANQHTIIEDLDRIIAKSLKKQKMQENKNISNTFVTTRRKRSISLDESTMNTSQFSKLPRPIVNQNFSNKTQSSTSTSKPLSRTKLPNFAAIHEKQFKKMENLVDHVSRKQERSKNLINSATKLKPVSAHKNVSILKNSNNIANEKSKALKKIDLGANTTTQIKKTQLNNTITADLNKTQEVTAVSKVVNLPDPRLASNTKSIKNGSISRRPPQQQPIRNYLKPLQTTNIEKMKANSKAAPTKSMFNLSTSLMVKPTTSSSSLAEKAKVESTKPTFNLSTSLMVKPATSSTIFAEKANASYMSNEDKMASRLQRHMDLFKGRIPSTRAGVASRRNETILKGVRSNRRFELQMQHRKNLEQ